MTTRHRIATGMAVMLMLIAAACGDDSDDTVSQSGARPDDPTATADGDGSFPVTVSADNGEVSIEARPEAIVSLSPTGTEMLFAIGAGDQVVAVDEYSYYPEEAPVTDLSGFQPNVEAIASYEPDLVVLSTDPGDVVDSLEAIGIPAIHLDAARDLDDTYRQLELLGAATGNLGSAAEVVAQMQTDIDEIVEGLPDDVAERTYFHELDSQLYSITSDTFIGRVYALLGLRSIGDEAGDDAGGYPQLSEEYVVAADPDFVFLADAQCCDQSPETVAARPGWDTLTAMQEGRVIVVDEDAASRWGPRIVDFLRDVADQVVATADAG